MENFIEIRSAGEDSKFGFSSSRTTRQRSVTLLSHVCLCVQVASETEEIQRETDKGMPKSFSFSM
jgi:hypothetical protein